MNPADCVVAWDHSPTRQAWVRHVVMNLVGLLGWIALWFGSLTALVRFMSSGFTVLFVPLLIYAFYRAFIQAFSVPLALRAGRILREYPWVIFESTSYGLSKRAEVVGRQCGWFEFLNPARSGQRLVMVFPDHRQVGWWHRRMAPRANVDLKAQIDTVWFAGDPRLVGLIAAPTASGVAPRRMRILHQQMGSEGGPRSLAEWGVTADDIERGRRVGVRPDAR